MMTSLLHQGFATTGAAAGATAGLGAAGAAFVRVCFAGFTGSVSASESEVAVEGAAGAAGAFVFLEPDDSIATVKIKILNELIKYDCELIALPDQTQLTQDILQAISEVSHVADADIIGRCRKREFIDSRVIYATFIRKGTSWSLMKIARHLNRNHATVIHATKTFEALIQTDSRFKKKVNDVIALLNNKKIYIIIFFILWKSIFQNKMFNY